MTDDVYDRCVSLYRSGQYPREIEQTTGLSRRDVLNALGRARKRKDITPHRYKLPKPLSALVEQSRVRTGSIKQMSEALTVEQRAWLVKQAEDLGCESIAELLAEIVRDEHASQVLNPDNDGPFEC